MDLAFLHVGIECNGKNVNLNFFYTIQYSRQCTILVLTH